MKLFKCQSCGQVLFFENSRCERCGHHLGYLPHSETMSAVTPEGVDWIAMAQAGKRYRFCSNWEKHACNWLVEAGPEAAPFCVACSHNRTVPDVSDPLHHTHWLKLEVAKRRLFYSLLKLRLPLPRPGSDDPQPLVFDFLAELPSQSVVTGHDNGVITISLTEADDPARETLRTTLHEPYRTLLGHFRHEVGHFYWDKLVRDGGNLEAFRALFGDERKDYQEALERYYLDGPLANWRDKYVTAYATMHPWEDFAETWAHYLHIVDTLEMAYAFGVSVAPRLSTETELAGKVTQNPYSIDAMEDLVAQWLPIVFAVNSLNRTMGQPDLYPFVLSPPVIAKLGYVRRVITTQKKASAAAADKPSTWASRRRRAWSLLRFRD